MNRTATCSSLKKCRNLLDLQRLIYHDQFPKKHQSVSLLDCLLQPINLRTAWEQVSSNGGAETPGPDGMNCRRIRANLDRWLRQLQDGLEQQTFVPGPVREIEIPKSEKGTRTITVLNVADRVVHTAVRQILEPVIDPQFHACSFGFRPGCSVQVAVTDVLGRLQQQDSKGTSAGWAVHLDVANCFPSIEQGRLIQSLRRLVDCPPIIELTEKLISTARRTRGWLFKRYVGIAQGSGLSPLLCNVALNGVDQLLDVSSQRLPTVAGRYADDLFLAAQTRSELQRMTATVAHELKTHGLSLRSPVSEPIPLTDGVTWLGIQFRQIQRSWETRPVYILEIPGPRVKQMLSTIEEITTPPKVSSPHHANIAGEWIGNVNTKLKQWRASIQLASNSHDVCRALDERAYHCVQRLLQAIIRQTPAQLVKQHSKKTATGFPTWEAQGQRLIRLSQLPPELKQYPRRQPDWMV